MLTLDPRCPVAEAIAVGDGRVLAVGGRAAMRTLAGAGISDARVIFNYQRDHAPLRRTPTLDQIGGSALYLLSGLSGAVTGEIHFVDCGYNVVAMPDLERRDLIVAGGDYQGRDYVAAVGHYCGTFRGDWLGVPAAGRPVYLRYGEVHEVRGGRIVQSSCLWDILDLIRQAGLWPLAPSLGVEGMWPGPITGDGLLLDATDPAQSAASLAQTLAMQGTLGDFRDQADAGRRRLKPRTRPA